MTKQKEKLIFTLILISLMLLSISFVSANNVTDNTPNQKLNLLEQHNTINNINNENNPNIHSNNPINKNKTFTDLNNIINEDLNKTEIILTEDYIYQEEYDSNFTEGINITHSVSIDGQGHLIYFDKPHYIFNIKADNVTLKNITFYNSQSMNIISCNASNLHTTNITISPPLILTMNIISNDIYDIYNQNEVINIEIETKIANTNIWVEIPELLNKTNLTTNSKGKITLTLTNITKSGLYTISSDFITTKENTRPYAIAIIPIIGADYTTGYRKTIRIIYREKPKDNNSFNDLQLLINNTTNNEINLEKDYEYYNGDKPININKPIIINGNNHIIDAKNASKIFNIQADNVTIKNITLTGASSNPLYKKSTILNPIPILTATPGYNGVIYNQGIFEDTNYINYQYTGGYDSGAINCSGNNLKIINSTLTNNYGTTGGGIYITGNNLQLINVTFANNSAQRGGAIYNTGKNTSISNSQFNSNNALYGDSIYSNNDINIQNCNFTHNPQTIIFCRGNWQINNITSNYYNSFIKFDYYTDFKFNLTHIKNNQYNLKITVNQPWESPKNKKFNLNIDNTTYTLQTDENSQANLNLNLSQGAHPIEVYNPLTKLNIKKTLNITTTQNPTKKQIKYPTKIIAKNKAFNKKTKIKKYTATLKNKNKPIKNKWITLKINKKTFKAKTNNQGKAIFKITKINKKGKYTTKITYKGNTHYKPTTKTIKITIK